MSFDINQRLLVAASRLSRNLYETSTNKAQKFSNQSSNFSSSFSTHLPEQQELTNTLANSTLQSFSSTALVRNDDDFMQFSLANTNNITSSSRLASHKAAEIQHDDYDKAAARLQHLADIFTEEFYNNQKWLTCFCQSFEIPKILTIATRCLSFLPR
jgi:hypothetical protein